MILAVLSILATVYTRSMERVNSLDPLKAQSAYDSKVLQLIYETPLNVDYSARPYRLTSGLCELPEVSEDGLTYTFHMVPDAPLTANAVVAQLERLRDPANAAAGGWTMSSVKAFHVVSDQEFRVELKERRHVFPWMMAMTNAAIPGPDGKGTGPYRLAAWRKNHEMRFERNCAWRGWKTAKEIPGCAPVDTIRFYTIDDVSTQWLMFLKGELDFLGEISRDNWDAVVNEKGELDPRLVEQGIQLYSVATMDVFYIGMNMRDPVVGKNKKLRQALSCAFDRETWCRFYNNRITPANGPVPPGVEGRLETPAEYGVYDVEKAKRLMAEAGYPGGIDPETGRRLVLTLAIGRPSQDSREMGELLANFYEAIGVRFELAFYTWEAFVRAVNEGRVQLYLMGWVGDYPDAENFLQLFHSKNASPGPNHSNYVNSEYDAAYDRAMAAESAEARNVQWQTCQKILREDCPWIFTHYSKVYSLMRERVKNYIPSHFPYGQEIELRIQTDENTRR